MSKSLLGFHAGPPAGLAAGISVPKIDIPVVAKKPKMRKRPESIFERLQRMEAAIKRLDKMLARRELVVRRDANGLIEKIEIHDGN